jgi:hypothetical protein
MTTNAGTWFFQEPEHNSYLISERLNSTFWNARVVDVYWKCTQAESPFQATGYSGSDIITLEWVPNDWLRLTIPAGSAFNMDALAEAVSKRILLTEPSFGYQDADQAVVTEWHRDGGQQRWSEIQGNAAYVQPHRL